MSTRISSKSFFIGGLAAGAIALVISLLLRSFAGGLFIPEIASLTLFSLTPGEVESQAVQTLGSLAKYSSFIGAVIVNIIVYGLISILLGRILYGRLPWKSYLGKAVQSSVIAYIILLAITSILITLTEASAGPVSASDVIVYLIPPTIAFGFTLPALYQRIPINLPTITNIDRKKKIGIDTRGNEGPKATEGAMIDRRVFLRSAIASAVALPILYYGANRLLFPTQQQQAAQPIRPVLPPLQSRPIPAGFENPMLSPLLKYEVTPTELFYRIDINPVVPTVNAETWRLGIKGLVDNPIELTYEELKAMPSVEQVSTLGCVSNKIGGDLISNAIWKGVPLKNLLNQAQIRSSARYIVFRCFDGYDVGVPLEKGLEDGTILAYEMNRATLTPTHGYPARVIVPNIYGMMNAKWITEIEIVDYVYEGFWQRKGWSNTAVMNTLSSIVIPGSAALRTRFRGFMPENSPPSGLSNSTTASESERRVSVGGIAFAGSRGVSKVEISIDNGATWRNAVIKEPLSRYAWVLWAVELNLTSQQQQRRRQQYTLSVRATDKTGNVQTSEITEPFPNGATGYHMINVQG